LDHKWGRNVLDLGLGSTGATICSRYPATPQFVLTNAPGFAGGTKQLWIISLDTDAPWEVHSVGFPPSLGNFPYGEPVEPDLPM
jgi:hypothetical protein